MSPEANPAPWKIMALRSALCLICTIMGWAFAGHHEIASLTWFAGAYLTGGWDLSHKVWDGFREREFGTDFLMLLVALSAAFIGEYAEGSILMFLFSISGAMERFAHGRTEREINALLHSAPKTARLLENGTEREVPVAELRPDQIVRVTANEQIPVDLLIEKGESTCDESMLTGESLPISKAPGDTALAGTLNLNSVLDGRVLRPAEDSALHRIIRLIEQAQHLKAPAQRLTDRFGTRYTGLVLTLCTGVFFTWWLGFGAPPLVNGEVQSAFYRAMTLLVVMSPCALVLSIPSAILSAIAYGAKHGILFRGGAAIETLAAITHVAMDKTGTLTEGNLHITAIEPIEGTEHDILATAASLARISNHPMSRSIAREADRRSIPREDPTDSQTIPGQGLRATLHGQLAALGNRELLHALRPGLTLPPQPTDASEVWILTPTHLGRILLRDRLRPEAPALIARLHAHHLKTLMLTGDKTGTAETMARESGVQEVLSQLRPEQKVAAIQHLKLTGAIVAMIGDGVNDAPVLAAADVGIAMGARGSDAAIEQAEVVLMNDRLENFLLAFHLSTRARRIIYQNLALAFLVIIGMSITTLLAAHLPLAVGVIAHEGSTVIVVLNSLRLLFGKASSQQPAR